MYKKSCPYCKGDSYSAASQGRWECPYCNADLTIFMPQPAGSVGAGHSVGSTGNAGAGTAREKTGQRDRNKLVQLGTKKGRRAPV